MNLDAALDPDLRERVESLLRHADESDSVVSREAERVEETPTAADELTADERVEVDAMRRQMGASMIRQWKINRALHAEYGGRIIYQQMGPEPLDAYRAFLDQQCAAGALRFMDEQVEAAFWNYFTNEEIHDFMAPGSEDEQNAFAVPPWERKATG